MAPSGVNTTFFQSTDVEGISDVDGDGFPNFFGTTAAAPHVAGVAALLKDLNPAASPDEIYNVLKAAAIDMDDPATPGFDTGFDFGTGFGLIRADVTFGPPPGPPPFEAEPNRLRFSCRSATRCRILIACNRAQVAGNQCANPIEVLVPARALRTAGEVLATGPRQISFGASIANVSPGAIAQVRLRLPKRIRNFIRKTKRKSIGAVMQVRSAAGAGIQTTHIKIRLK
ncbi:MAG: S8 family serine peptidase [bacterium]